RGSRLDAEDEMVASRGVSLEHDLVLVIQPRLAQEDLLHLARIEVDALEDHHVVGPPAEAVQSHARAAAPAPLARADAGDVPGPVADQRQALPRERRDDELAGLALRQGSAARGVPHLGARATLPQLRSR